MTTMLATIGIWAILSVLCLFAAWTVYRIQRGDEKCDEQ